MNDTATGLLPAAGIALPDFLTKLSESFRDPLANRQELVSDWLGVPKPSEYPSPGQAKTWGKDEWSKWANDHGYEWAGESTHAWQWKHPKSAKLIISVAKTPGDVRTPMAMAMQTRRMARSLADDASVVLRAIFDKGVPSDWPVESESHFKTLLINTCQDPEQNEKLNKLNDANLLAGKSSDTSTVGELRKWISRCTGMGQSIRQVLMATGISAEATDSYWDRLKLAAPEAPVHQSAIDMVKDHLEMLQEAERMEREERRAKRDREEAERKARQEEKNRPPTIQEVIQGQIDAHENNLRQGMVGIANAAVALLDRVKLLQTQAAKSYSVPDIEDPAPLRVALIERNQEIARLKEEAVLLQASHELDQQTIANMGSRVSEARLKQLEDAESHLNALAGLVIDAVASVKTANPFQMVEILNSLAHSAEEFKTKP